MAYKNKDEFMGAVGTFVGERTDDDALNFIKEMSETFDEVEARGNDTVEQRIKEVEDTWRQKYRDAFFTPSKDTDIIEVDEEIETKTPRTFEDLFSSEVK